MSRTLSLCALVLALAGGCADEVVDDVEEHELAAYAGTHAPNGFVDALGRQYVSGWACIDDYGEPLWVHFYDGTTYLGSTVADKDRPDVGWICGGRTRRGFNWHMPRLSWATHTINVHVTSSPTPSRVYAALPGQKTVSFPYPVSGDHPFGYVESISMTRVTGWACDRNAPGSPIDLQVYIQYDGASPPVFLTGGQTTSHRGDVAGLCGSGAYTGFDIPLPWVRGGFHNVIVFGVNRGPGNNNALNETDNVPNLLDRGCWGSTGGNDAPWMQAALDGGADLILCPHHTYRLQSPQCMVGPEAAGLCYRTAGQLIASKFLPAGDGPDASAPVLLIEGDFTTAVAGLSLDNLRLRNVVVDGNRNNLGYKEGSAAVVFGGGQIGTRVDHAKIRDTRSWSSLHMFESCGGVEVSYNKIEDAGCSKWGKGCRAGDPTHTWADGISFACWDGQSAIFRNVIENATDGAIVLFAPAGTEVFSNTIRAIDRELLGGVNMVDQLNPVVVGGVEYSNFQGVDVHDNVIDAVGATIDVGIAQGWHTWFCGPPEGQADARRLLGGTVRRNRFQGAHFRWAAGLDWVDGWTFTDNVFAGTFSGGSKAACNGGGTVPSPSRTCARAHQVNNTRAGVVQADCPWVGTGESLHILLHDI